MNPRPTDWSRHDLERFLDADLERSDAEQLAGALRESPALRARLTHVARADALARAALLAPTPMSPGSRPRRMTIPAAALSLLVLVLVLLAVTSHRHTPAPAPIAVSAATDSMVIFSIPITRPHDPPSPADASLEKVVGPAPTDTEPKIDPPSPAPLSLSRREYAARLDAALTRGDARTAADLLDSPDPALRVLGYQRLGVTLRSVTTARLVLNELPADARLAACRELIAEPRWRTLSAASLTTLRDDPATRDAVNALLAELARSPEFAPLVERVTSPRQSPGPAPIDRSL